MTQAFSYILVLSPIASENATKVNSNQFTPFHKNMVCKNIKTQNR